MDRVAAQYNSDPEREWQRLAKDAYHSLEFHVNLHHFLRHLPPQGLILDAGGGPGRYAIALCRLGYEVVLQDLSEGCLTSAQAHMAAEPENVRNRLRECLLGDVRDLSALASHHFDAVLCLDPLTYIPQPEERAQAIHELIRVAKPGATICLGVRGYLALLRTILRAFPDLLVDPSLADLLRDGNIPIAGHLCHFSRAAEIRQLAESCGLVTLAMAGSEGLSTGLPEATNNLPQSSEQWQHWQEIVLQTSTEPAVVDMAEHILYVGRSPA